MQTTVLKIQGMSCDHCKKAVTEALQELAGVETVEVDLAAGQATVTHDPALASEAALKEAVKEAGYEVLVG